MSYSHARLRNTLAVVRIVLGILLLNSGANKISSLRFAWFEFPQFLWDATHGAAVGFYAEFLDSFVWEHVGRYGVLVGFWELFIGVGLVLGLAVRPVSVFGMLYTLNLMLATWMAPGPNLPVWRYVDNQTKLVALFLIFLLFGIGHAGESWGVGSLYHGKRHRKWVEAEAELAANAAEDEKLRLRYMAEDDPFPQRWNRPAAGRYHAGDM